MTARIAIVAAAILAAAVPIPPENVERWYSSAVYPRLQSIVTPVTNLVPIALFDVACGVLLVAALVLIGRTRRGGWRHAIRSVLTAGVVTACVLYLVFLALWGLNYRRVPLEDKLAFDGSRVTRQAAIDLANGAIMRVNRMHAAAHAQDPDDRALEQTFAGVQRALGASRTATVGVPKRSLLTFYFRRAAIDGMTDPYFLEIIINPEVLSFERPFVLAHEWAHLAGYARESEANFVAWVTCLRGDPLAQYSGWLSAYQHAAGALSREERSKLARLESGPRHDIDLMIARYRKSTPAVREAAREVYDSYLRANRVAEGIASYDAVLRLMLGGTFDEHWTPRPRAR